MKRLILLIVLLFALTGCAKNNPAAIVKSNNNISTAPVTSVPAEVIAPVTADPKPSGEPETEIEPTEEPQYPILDEEITEALTTYMYESFGGFGNEQFAVNWYKYIDYWEVYRNEDFYSGILHLNERPFDSSARLLLNEYYSEDELDILCPILLDVGVALDLDDIDLCLIGEALYKIRTLKDTAIYYYSLVALDIPIYDFLASGFGQSIPDVKSAISKNEIPRKDAYKCLIDYMAYTYKDEFEGLSMEKVNLMSMAAIANFDDVRIETLSVVDQDYKLVNTYEKLN
jgi:hypothetical protein